MVALAAGRQWRHGYDDDDDDDEDCASNDSTPPRPSLPKEIHSRIVATDRASLAKCAFSLSLHVSPLLVFQVCCADEATAPKDEQQPTVVQGISVPNGKSGSEQPVAQERVDFDGAEDQLALESNIAEERDGGGHGHHGHGHGHGHHGVRVPAPDNLALESAQIDTYSAPPQPSGNSYGAPKAPAVDGYGAPQAPVVDGYGAPQAPIVDSYGSPQGPVQSNSYGAPQGPPVHSGPIPVPLPVAVRPSSLVLPQGPPQSPNQGYGPPPKRPSYRPPPPKKPSYRPPPPPKRPPPKKVPQYRPRDIAATALPLHAGGLAGLRTLDRKEERTKSGGRERASGR